MWLKKEQSVLNGNRDKKTYRKFWPLEDLKGTVASQDKCCCLPCLLLEYPAEKQEVGYQAEGNVSFTGTASFPSTPTAAVVFTHRRTEGRRNPVPSLETPVRNEAKKPCPWTQPVGYKQSNCGHCTTTEIISVPAQGHLTSSISPGFDCNMTGNFQPQYFSLFGSGFFLG